MQHRPMISIVTVCRNDLLGLATTLDSVACQNYDGIEHVVIDAASTDGSATLPGKYPHVVEAISEKDAGLYDGMNKGLRLCTGEFVLFLNSGDCLDSPGALAKFVDLAQEADVISGDLRILPNEGESYVFKTPDIANAASLRDSFLPHPSTLFRRSLFSEIGNYDLDYRFAADYEFYTRAIFAHHATYRRCPVVLSAFKLDGASSKPENLTLVLAEKRKAYAHNVPGWKRAGASMQKGLMASRRALKRALRGIVAAW